MQDSNDHPSFSNYKPSRLFGLLWVLGPTLSPKASPRDNLRDEPCGTEKHVSPVRVLNQASSRVSIVSKLQLDPPVC